MVIAREISFFNTSLSNAPGWSKVYCQIPYHSSQCWGRYFLKVTRYILLFTFVYYSYILLRNNSNYNILSYSYILLRNKVTINILSYMQLYIT